MNLNNEAHFAQSPLGVDIPRSTFDRSFSTKGSCKSGKINCTFVDEILPGDTVDLKQTILSRMTTPYYPVMDNCTMDRYVFFVPNRLVWKHWKEFNGENNTSAWTQTEQYIVPQINAKDQVVGTSHTRLQNDLAHQMGIPLVISEDNKLVNALPFRAYRLIYNEWFRDQNTQDPKLIEFGDNETDYSLFKLENACRIHDYFGSCLPDTQKGNAVRIALSGYLPVTTKSTPVVYGAQAPMRLSKCSDGTSQSNPGQLGTLSGQVYETDTSFPGLGGTVYINNLIADAGTSLGNTMGIDVNALRLAVQTQKILEKLAVGGSRYVEFIKSMFGVTSPDARQQRPELLGYSRCNLNMQEVTQTSPWIPSETQTSPLGTQGAYSKTVDGGLTFSHSFTEHGYLIGLMVIRHNRTYSQGINRMWKRRTMTDFYLPALAHIGEQPVYKYEIYANASGNNNGIFGYQEPFADYRFKPSIASGEMDASISGSLGEAWSYADVYDDEHIPTLSAGWMSEGDQEVARTLTVTDKDQFIYDCWTSYKHTRCMPVYGTPGLVDHF